MFVKLSPLLRHFRRTALFACIFSAVSAYAQQVATPAFSPVAGTYASAQSVTISTTTGGATIRYTTDGSTPTETNGTVYSGAVNISSSTQLNAIAYESSFTDSAVTSGLYTITSSPAPSLNVIYNFAGGGTSYSNLVQGTDGNFYGTTANGGSNGLGTVFQMTPAGVLTTLVTFTGFSGSALGSSPQAGLVQGSDGNFYGTTANGGSIGLGTVFQMTPAGVLTTLVTFTGFSGSALGSSPQAGLVQGSDGNFYGTTLRGGANLLYGTVFKMTPAGAITTLYSFDETDGADPSASLVQGSDGNFYGTTKYGGSGSPPGYGTVFKLTPAGVLTTLVSFGVATGSGPSGLVQGSDGNFYGTLSGTTSGGGAAFKITPAGVLTILVSFGGANGSGPNGLVQGSDGNFYGTLSGSISGGGAVFEMTPAGALSTLASFDSANGYSPGAALVQGSDGNFYGTTQAGGSSNQGVIFQLIVPPAAAAPVFSPAAGSYAATQSVTLTSTTSGASIVYTTDGSTPTEVGGAVTNGTLYSTTPVAINGTTTLNAIAFKTGLIDSGVATAVYNINILGVEQAPTFSPGAGTYTSAQSVTISSLTSGASIAYTTDGSTPTEIGGSVHHGTSYSTPVTISANTTLEAISFDASQTKADSTVSAAAYTIQAAIPTFNPSGGTYTNAQSVTLTSATSGAMFIYTTDGSTPTESGGAISHGTPYSSPINVTTNTTLRAIAFKSGLADSTASSNTYILQVSTPNFSPLPGIYISVQSVTITSATSGALINYTTDGSIPTETHGTLYTGPVSISTTTTLSAIAFKTGFSDSSPAITGYTIMLPPTAPTFSLAAGTYAGAQTVAISDNTSYSTIRYTTDGSTPTETNGIVYSGPVSITKTTALKAIAYESGFPDSPVTSGIYTITSSPATILNVIYNFPGYPTGGGTPYAALIQGTDGNFYGTTNEGAGGNEGTVFKITSTGSLTTLVTFNGGNGEFPFAGLVQGTDGNFYGTTNTSVANPSLSFPGTAFKITPTGTLTTLVSFSSTNGIWPFAGLIQGTDGNFYGMTFAGGTADYGTVFKITSSGTLTTLVSFTGSNGGFSFANLLQGSDGNFYGTTFAGGSTFVSATNPGDGTVFKMTPAGTLTTLVSFTGGNGELPAASLVQGNDGNFYGTTADDTVNDDGTVFKMTPAGVLTTLVYLSTATGQFPNGLVQGSDGNFYGTTQGTGSGGSFGTVFKITPAGVLTTLASFDGPNGNEPLAGLVQGSDGNFYGTTGEGGSFGYGVVFQLIVPSATAAPVFSPAPGTYTSAQTVTITSATSGASIRYTTNGSTPTETTGTLYSGPVNISSTTTLNALAFKSGLADSAVISPAFTIQTSTSSGSSSSSPASSGGGGGGGAFDDWFLGFLAFAGLWRALTRANHKRE